MLSALFIAVIILLVCCQTLRWTVLSTISYSITVLHGLLYCLIDCFHCTAIILGEQRLVD